MSTISIDSTKLHAWCDAIQKSISRERQLKLKALAKERLENANRKRWWRPWARAVTPDQVMDDIEAEVDDDFTTAWHAAHHAEGQYAIAAKLKAASLFADRVVVGADDLERLHYWSEDIARSIFKPGELR